MFNKIKALKDIRSQAKELEKALAAVEVTGSAHGVELTLNGKQEMIRLSIPEDMASKDAEKHVKSAYEEAVKDVQKHVQKVMQEMGGMPDLSSLGM